MRDDSFMQASLSERVQHLEDEQMTGPSPRAGAPSAGVLDGVHRALLDGETHYTDRPGIAELRELFAERLNAELGCERSKDAVIVTNSETEALFACLLGLRGASDGAPKAVLRGDASRHRAEVALASVLGFEVEHEHSDEPEAMDIRASNKTYRIFQVKGLEAKHLRDGFEADRTLVIGAIEAAELTAFPVGFAFVPTGIAKNVRTWKQALSICTAAPSQRATILSLRGKS